MERIDAYEVIRDYQEKADWPYRDFIAEMHSIGDVFKFYWFSRQSEEQAQIPPLLLAARDLRVEIVAGYRTTRNELGLRWEIIFNTKHVDLDAWRSRRWQHAETLAHEMLHLATENLPGYKPCTKNYHHGEFRGLAAGMGLHVNAEGAHAGVADGQFALLMDKLFVPPPAAKRRAPIEAPKVSWWDAGKDKKKGSSTLVLYVNESCTRKPVCKIRSGRADLRIRCDDCGGEFKPNYKSD